MIYETDKKEFFHNYAKTTGVVLTWLIDEIDSFKGKAYVDSKNRYYISINYGYGEVITAFQTYSLDLYNEILNIFPDISSIDFIHNGYIGRESIYNDVIKCLNYHYKFQGILNFGITAEQPFIVKLITENDINIAKQYDDLYFNSLTPKDGRRMTNQIKHVESLKSGDFKIYFAMINNIPIGYILAYHFKEYFAWVFPEIEIEENYRQKGYGAAFLTEVTKDNLKHGDDLYYSGVSADNIASRKTAEKAGYTIATSRISINVNKEGEQNT